MDLPVGERHDEEPQPLHVWSDEGCQRLDLLKRLIGGIWVCMEVDRVCLHPALCHHRRRDRAVDASGEKEHPLAGRSYGKAADGLLLPCIEIGISSYLACEDIVRIVKVDSQGGVDAVDDLCKLHRNLPGGEREALVLPLDRYPERAFL